MAGSNHGCPARRANARLKRVKSCKQSPCNRRGFPTPMIFRRTRDRLNAAPCTSSRFRILLRPCRCHSPHLAGFVQMREGSLRQFAAQFLQPLVAVAPHPPPIFVRPLLLFRFPLAPPLPPPSLRLGNVTPEFLFVQFGQHSAAVIALVGRYLFHSRVVEFSRHCLRLLQRFVDCGRVPCIGRLQGQRQQRSAGKIHRMLGFVRQVGAPIQIFPSKLRVTSLICCRPMSVSDTLLRRETCKVRVVGRANGGTSCHTRS